MNNTRKSGKFLTRFNVIAGMILTIGFILAIRRFSQGIASVTNLDNNYPWGLWIGFDVMTGVALSAGGFVIGTTVHLFGMKEYQPILRPAILTGFLGYFFVVVGLLFDLGRPWRLPYPMFVSYGVTSVLFLVGWHVALYLSTQFVELSPAIFEWLGWKNWRKAAVFVTTGATIFGVILSTLHQSALGALFLIVPSKLHPLWYSYFIPLFFFISAIAAGIAMVILESSLAHRYFPNLVDHNVDIDRICLGLAKGASVTLFTYFGAKWIGVALDNTWNYLFTGYGLWFLVEVLGFVLLPAILFAVSVRIRNVGLAKVTSVITVLGIFLNRINVSIIAFNYQLPPQEHYVPSWMEFFVSLSIVVTGILTYRWFVTHMSILRNHPDYENTH